MPPYSVYHLSSLQPFEQSLQHTRRAVRGNPDTSNLSTWREKLSRTICEQDFFSAEQRHDVANTFLTISEWAEWKLRKGWTRGNTTSKHDCFGIVAKVQGELKHIVPRNLDVKVETFAPLLKQLENRIKCVRSINTKYLFNIQININTNLVLRLGQLPKIKCCLVLVPLLNLCTPQISAQRPQPAV